jgi:hypothetical protein
VDVDRRLLYFTSKVDLRCHINHHQTSHRSSPLFIQSNNHSSGTLISLLGGCNFESSSWSEVASEWAASEFPPTPPNPATPVRSSYSCPLGSRGPWPTATSKGWGNVISFVNDTHVCHPPPSGFRSRGGAGKKNEDVAIATLLALGPNYRISNATAMASYGQLSGAKIVASTLAACRTNTDDKEEPLILSEGINQCQHKQLSGLG